MFRFSNTTSIFELKSNKSLTFNEQGVIFAPSNSILPLNISPIFMKNREILLRKWGFTNESGQNVITISLGDAISNAATFEPCIIPLNGYFLNFDRYCIYMHNKKESVFYAAGVIRDDSFLFVTTEQANDNFVTLEIPLILDDSCEEKWLSKEWEPDMKSEKLCPRNVSKLALSNSLYNGNRCTEEYINFELQTKTINLAKASFEKDFPKNKDWFDE